MAEPLPLAAAGVGCVVVTVSRSPASSHSPRPLPKGPWSASGVLLALDPGLILCQGAIFSPFLLDSPLPQHGSQCQGLLAESFSSDMQIQVLGPGPDQNQTPSQNWLSGDLGDGLPALRLNPLSNHQQEVPSGTKQWEAELILMAPCLPFQDAFSKVFTASDQWNFGGSEVGQEASSLEEDLRFLHWFALLRLLDCDFRGAGGWLRCLPAKWLKKGDTVFACGSPFGSFCPDIFMNTLSKGIVSNTAGDGNALILTDARCLPGTEGGGVFATLGANLHLVGIIVAPLCWKSNEWVGLTLVCAVDHILAGIRNILSEPPWFLKSWLHSMALVSEPRDALLARDGTTQQMLAAVVLVECGPTWGSGVLVNSRLVLTCRHVVNGASSVSVRFQASPDKASVVKGKVVFATQDSSPYDIALVELEESLSAFREPVLASQFYAGEDVSIVGFGVFGQACGPSITSGILSAVITVEDKPVMLQATCAVHGGSSGGALFATHSGKLLGIVASNTKDNSVGVTYPHLNFSIPVTVLQPAILEYIRSRSLSGFQALNWVGDKIQVVWRLQREPEEIPLSKL